MTSRSFTDGVTLTEAAWFNDADTLIYGSFTGGGTANVITATGPASFTAYASGQRWVLIPGSANTGATTLNISGKGARNVFAQSGAACTGGELRAGIPAFLIDDGTQLNIVSSHIPPINWTPFNMDDRVWGAGAAAVKTSWTAYGASATYAKSTTSGQFSGGPAGSAITRAGTDCGQKADVATYPQWPALAFWAGRTVTYGRWVYATVASRARIMIDDGVTQTFSGYHTGNSTLQFLTVTKTLSASATIVSLQDQVDTGNTTATFSGGTFVIGSWIPNTMPCVWQGRKAYIYASIGGQQTAGTTRFYGASGPDATESNVALPTVFKAVIRNLSCHTDVAPAGSETAVITFRNAGSDSILTATISGSNSSAQDTTHEVAVSSAAGTIIAIKVVTSASAASLRAKIAFEMEEVPL